MAIHDSDVRSPGRSDPMPNSHDTPQEVAGQTLNFSGTTGQYNLLRIVKSSTSTFIVPAVGPGSAGTFTTASSTSTIAHGLGYIPIVVCYSYITIAMGGDNYAIPFNLSTSLSNSATTWTSVYITADATNIYIKSSALLYGATPSGNPTQEQDYTLKYFLLQASAQ